VESRWLEDRERDPRPPGERRQATEPIGHAAGLRGLRASVAIRTGLDRGPGFDPLWEVDDEQVDRPARQERAGDRDPLVDVGRGHDDEPLWLHAAGDGLDRVERLGKVQPRDDGAGRLGLRGESQGERRPAARQVTPERDAHPARQATRAEDRVQRREPGREDLGWVRLASRTATDLRLIVRNLERHGRERADDLTESRRSGRAPLRPKGRESRRHVRGEHRHGSIIEHPFE
jgi:hypothetical protein